MVHIRPPCSCYRYLSVCPTLASVSIIYSQKVTPCFTSASVAICLPASASEGVKREGSHWAHKIRAVGRMVCNLPIGSKTGTIGSMGLCDFPLIALLNGTWLASSVTEHYWSSSALPPHSSKYSRKDKGPGVPRQLAFSKGMDWTDGIVLTFIFL
jgi:hypothetical protein